MDFARLHALHEAGAFFLIRAKSGLRIFWRMARFEALCRDDFCPGTELKLEKM
jgi:hypothetical protein